MNKIKSPDKLSSVLVGPDGWDDAGVFKLTDEIALVQTLDFITPIVDDPYVYGQIAACNSISDVYAMGGRPVSALNIVCFDSCKLPWEYLAQILNGAQEVIKQADVALLGGHSIDDLETKFGLSVTGTIHPEKIILNNTIKEGDALVLTKPIGTGILSTAIKRAEDKPHDLFQVAIDSMRTLNRNACNEMLRFHVSACTDVTGFGLLGHLSEMLKFPEYKFGNKAVQDYSSGYDIKINVEAVPLFEGVMEFTKRKLFPGGAKRNRDYIKEIILPEKSYGEDIEIALSDPQTSGGLLISLPEEEADSLVKNLHKNDVPHARKIGKVIKGKGRIILS